MSLLFPSMFGICSRVFTRDDLERRYDGPIPPAAPPGSAIGCARLFDRLAADTVREVARRRAGLAAGAAVGDDRLDRLTRRMGFYRAHGVGWR
jgi:hypothetical protein